MRVTINTSDCERLDVSVYNRNVYKLPVVIESRQYLVAQGDDDRSEYLWLLDEPGSKNRVYAGTRDIEEDQDTFTINSEELGNFPT